MTTIQNTKSVFTTIESFVAFRSNWKEKARLKNLTANDFALLVLIKSYRSEDPEATSLLMVKKHFSAITNQNKLSNGMEPWFGAVTALRSVGYSLTYNKMSLYPEISDPEIRKTLGRLATSLALKLSK